MKNECYTVSTNENTHQKRGHLMKAGLRKALFILSAIFGGFGAFFIFIGGLCVGIADIPNLNYPLTAVVPLVFFFVLDILFVLLPIIAHRYWKGKPCKSLGKFFLALLGVFFVLTAIATPINRAIQKNNIMYIPHYETEPPEPSETATDNSTEDTKTECNHDLQETIIKEATEEAKGEKKYSCKKCDYFYIEEIPMLEPVIPETTEPQKVEILFREIPWGTTSKDAKQLLKSANSSISVSIWEKSYILYPDTMLYIGISLSEGVQEGGNILYAHNLTAGGYDIQMAQLHFAYTYQDSKIDRNADSLYAALYYFDVIEHEEVYKDLQQKMSDLYGSGKESNQTKSGWIAAGDYSGKYEYAVKQITWYGDNNTFVTLQWISSTNQADSIQNNCGISMLYGKTDAKSMLDNLEKALEQEKANADKENAAGNSDGL